MNRLFTYINNHKTRDIIIVLSIISIVTYALMLTNIFGILSEFDNSIMLDLSFYYTGEDFINNFRGIPALQMYYYQVIHYIDYLFIISFYPLITIVVAKIVRTKYYFLFIIPLLSMLFDLIENIIIDLHISFGLSQVMGTFCGLSTALKFITILISIFILIVLLVRKTRENGKTKISNS